MRTLRLQVRDAGGQRTVVVDKPLFTIGRQDDREFIFADKSKLGSYRNGDPVTECELTPGDVVRLGRGGGADLIVLEESGVIPAFSSITATAVRDLRHIATLLRGLSAIGTTRLLDDVLVLVLDAALEISGAERAFIMLAGEHGLELKLARARGRVTLAGPLETSRKIPAEVFASGRARLVRDLRLEDGDEHSQTLDRDIRSVLCLPLRLVRRLEHAEDAVDERRIGVLYLDSREQGTLVAGSMRMALETLATEAALAIENARLYRAALEQAALEQEMRTAASIQRALMPGHSRAGGWVTTSAAMLPCRSVGGDFFDYLPHGADAFRFALGDVSGKGPPAALLGALVQGMLSQVPPDEAPARTAARINDGLVARGIESRFLTLFCASLDANGSLTYCNAGHNPPILLGPGGVRRLTHGGPIVGAFADARFEQTSVALVPGEWVVVFSDGLSEALNPAGEEFGDSRLVDAVCAHADEKPEALIDTLFGVVRRFCAGAPQRDDLTVLALRYRGQ